MALSKRELELTAALLRHAADTFANKSCNDFDLPEQWTDSECRQLAAAIEESVDCEAFVELGTRIVNDAVAMDYLANRIREEMGE